MEQYSSLHSRSFPSFCTTYAMPACGHQIAITAVDDAFAFIRRPLLQVLDIFFLHMMHRALLLDDIVSLVVSSVGNVGNREDLRALATVNRLFRSFTLDHLWAMPIVWNLAKCMDASLWHIESDERGGKHTPVSHVDFRLALS
jgi:hypothetical protein